MLSHLHWQLTIQGLATLVAVGGRPDLSSTASTEKLSMEVLPQYCKDLVNFVVILQTDRKPRSKVGAISFFRGGFRVPPDHKPGAGSTVERGREGLARIR